MIDRSLNYGRHLIKRFLEECLPFSSVLDLGAGPGEDLKIAKLINPNASLHCIEAYENYALKLRLYGFDVHNINIERDSLPFANDSIDVLIMNQILEHTKEVFWIFHEITRVLRIGGSLIIGIPNLASLHNRILLGIGRQPSPIKTNSAHVRGFTKGDILDFLGKCFSNGYRIIDFGGSNFYPFPPILAKPLAKLFPTLAWGIFFLLKKEKPYSSQFLEYPVAEKLETNFYLGN